MESIVVFCGSKMGAHSIYAEEARRAGRLFAAKQIKLVYGGGGVGLMGEIARSVMANRGEVVGIITDFLQGVEGMDIALPELIVVPTMHERKQKMAAISDGVLVLPGAYGTLDELFEMVTLVQLSRGAWPIGIYNVNGYYDHLLQHIDLMIREGFLSPSNRDLIIVSDKLEELIDQIVTKSVDKSDLPIDQL